MAWCEENGIDFIFGLPGNAVLTDAVEVVRSSVIPSAKYCCLRSLLRLVNGSTTIDKRGAAAGSGADGAARHGFQVRLD
jgi:hypothetical protein